MKRLCIFILSLTLTLALCACGSPFKAACKLLDEGKYDEAIAAFEQLEPSEQVEKKLAQAKQEKFQFEYNAACKLMDEEKYDEAIAVFEQLEKTELVELKLSQAKDAKYRVMYADYFGEWVSAGQERTLIINEDKTGTLISPFSTQNLRFEFDENGFWSVSPFESEINLGNFYGVPSISFYYGNYFHNNDISAIVEGIEITKDNFWDYFEVGPVCLLDYGKDSRLDPSVPYIYATREILLKDVYAKDYAQEGIIRAIISGKEERWKITMNDDDFDITVPCKEGESRRDDIVAFSLNPFFDDMKDQYLKNHLCQNAYFTTKEPYIPSSTLYFSTSMSSTTVNENSSYTSYTMFPTEVLEASGTLLLYKEAPQS